MPRSCKLGAESRVHEVGAALKAATAHTPVVDGSGVRDGLERWAVMLADRAQPGIFAEKIILMTPGLNHAGLIDELNKHSRTIRYADPFVFFNLPNFPLVGSRQTLEQAAGLTLDRLHDAPFRRLHPLAGTPHAHRPESPFHSADILAGDIGAIRRYAPALLKHKTVVVEYATAEDLEDLRERGVSIVVTLMPSLDGKGELGRWSAATIEAVLVALRPDPTVPLSEDTYLDLMADIDWTPAIRYLRAGRSGHQPLCLCHSSAQREVHPHRTSCCAGPRYLPDELVETLVAYMPPIYLSRITGGQSPATGQRIEGYLYLARRDAAPDDEARRALHLHAA